MQDSVNKENATCKTDSKRFWQLKASDWIALCALLITMPGYIYLGWGWVVASDVELFTPRLIHFRHSGSQSGLLLIGATMSYLNSGQMGYDDIVLQEWTQFSVGGKNIKFNAEWFVNAVPGSNGGYESSAAPFLVKGGGGAASHEVFFYPRDIFCEGATCIQNDSKIEWEELKAAVLVTNEAWQEFSFHSKLGSGKHLSTRCRVQTDALKARLLLKDTRKYFELACWPY